MGEEVKKIMHVVRRPPHGTIYPYEGLEMVLIMAAYDQEISMAFIGDGLFCLLKDQDTTKLEIKGFMKTLGVLEDYDVEQIYVDSKSMAERGLTPDDFCIAVEVLEPDEMGQKMAEQDCIIPQ
ncbi:MAG: sulfurtransferase TusC [Candidatus Lambdaproteobacteria bacterium RIFOXYD2_FULL_50_16]|uniref:Sulfurtransferase TusC n=1 Tax=Candidatus Lambdaproteobacteria bacterium RIFOXYD2_FULL_50_16 TaxID=1817772 RepID=A0A1F6GBB7_9PROT|nr:MAG: sulfurtransferase TusC [Candidatus Lambdaproteobacteria bacterium RIFOXYD2_FULL_50_16]